MGRAAARRGRWRQLPDPRRVHPAADRLADRDGRLHVALWLPARAPGHTAPPVQRARRPRVLAGRGLADRDLGAHRTQPAGPDLRLPAALLPRPGPAAALGDAALLRE